MMDHLHVQSTREFDRDVYQAKIWCFNRVAVALAVEVGNGSV